MSRHHQMPKHEIENVFTEELKQNLVMKFGQFMLYCKRKIFIKKLYKKCDLKASSKHFLFFKESSVKRNLRECACQF